MHKIWIADDDEAIRVVLEESLSSNGFKTTSFSSADELVKNLENNQPDLIITDVQMPGMLGYDLLKHINNNYEDLPVIIMTAFADMQAAVESFGGGAFEYIPKPFDLEDAIKIIERALEEKPKTKGLKKETSLDIIGESQAMQNVFRSIGKLSTTIATVLIQGESGTGKELIAKSLHKNSPRHDMPFIALNMADIPKELVESELFGHEKGSFTGAVDKRIGRFEQANGGTLFLDEIGDMPLDVQTRLLRVLQEGEFFRVGGSKSIKVKTRIITATHKDLNYLVRQNLFREDSRGNAIIPLNGSRNGAKGQNFDGGIMYSGQEYDRYMVSLGNTTGNFKILDGNRMSGVVPLDFSMTVSGGNIAAGD